MALLAQDAAGAKQDHRHDERAYHEESEAGIGKYAGYEWSMPIVAEKMGAAIDDKIRDHLKVHRKGGQPCPTCGATITEVSPNNRITSYCRTCQDWGKTGLVEASIP